MVSQNKLILVILLVFLYLSEPVRSQGDGETLCSFQETCEKCLLTDLRCAWCTEKSYDIMKPRCMSQTDMYRANSCKKESILISTLHPVNLTENLEIRDFSRGSMQDAIQIKPQKAKLVLRKSQPYEITMKYKQAENYPLELYYLMDVTKTMMDDKETLVNIGHNLSVALGKLTENFRIGLGSFVDKPIFPYTMLGMEDNPCRIIRDVCMPTFDFQHQLSMTANISQFIEKVKMIEFSANMDDPEGGFDALMQILLCKDNIGWSEKSRKIVIFASDGYIHFAGDGLLAGIVKRNDKQCHLDDEGRYTGALEYDYPSVGEIYQVLLQKKTNVIFAVNSDLYGLYLQLHNIMNDISSVGMLAHDSSNILDLVERGYKSFIKRVQLTDNSPDYISIDYETTCNGLYSEFKKKASCENVEFGEEFEFKIKITLNDFPRNDNDYHQKIRIEDVSLNEYLELDIEIEKPCSKCLNDEMPEEGSIACNSHGDFHCGQCFCNNGWTGKTCHCDLQDLSNIRDLDNFCREPINKTNDDDYQQVMPLCSDRGDCICGECTCGRGFTGKYCECEECTRFNGGEHGTCNCGKFICDDGWTGDDCSCTTETSTCTPPDSGTLCYGNGICECGSCNCNSTFYGDFCESNRFNEENTLCKYYEPCIRCMIDRKLTSSCDNETEICRGNDGQVFNAEFFNDLNTNSFCIIRTTNDDNRLCEHRFSYHINEEQKSLIRIVMDPCKKVETAYIAIFIFLFTLILGLLLIGILKIRNVYVDKRECERFENQLKSETRYSLNQSPLYKSPVTQYEMPKLIRESNDDTYFD